MTKSFYPHNIYFFNPYVSIGSTTKKKKSGISHNNQGAPKVKLTINTEVAANTTRDVEFISLVFNSYI